MDLCFVTGSTLEEHPLEHVAALLERDDGYVWLDVPVWTLRAGRVLKQQFRFHPVALDYCATRNHMPMIHGYADHLFLVLHRPFLVGTGQAKMIELDLFLGERFLVTVHGPVDAAVPEAVPLDEVRETLERMRGGRVWPGTPLGLMHALLSLIALHQRTAAQEIAGRVAVIEEQVLAGALDDPESSLEEMFLVRQELLAVGTMASMSSEVLARAARLLPAPVAGDAALIADLEDMLDRVDRMATREQAFLAGVIELYRARTDTKMMIAVERLAVLAAVTLPITAIASVYGMNVIVNETTHVGQLVAVLALMVTISGVLLRWTKTQGWW